MGLETIRIKAAIGDDRHGTSPRDLIYLYNINASFPPCDSNIMLLLPTCIISVLQNVGERVAEVLRKLFFYVQIF